ncbi:MAG: glycosyltransferase family 2 protein [Planctomycetota bacterium]
MPDLSVIVPAYNEEPGIAEMLDELDTVLGSAPEIEAYEIIVVDDGSTDQTAAAVRSLTEERDTVRLLARDRNRGYGSAVKHGIRHAAHPLLAIVDGDGSYPVERLPELVRQADDAEMVVAARDPAVAQPLNRRLAKWTLTRLASYLAETAIPDLNSGMRLFHRHAVERYLHLLPPRFSLTTTLTLAMLCDELTVRYLPVELRPRTGRSKIRPVRDTLSFLLLIATTVTYFRPLKVLVPLAAALFFAGLVKGAVDVAAEANLKTSDLLLLIAGIQVFALALIADLVSKRR